MFADLQAKAVMLVGGLVLLLASNVGSYFYGRSDGKELQQGKQAAVEVARVDKMATTVIAQSAAVVAGVIEDNNKEGKANERYETAMAELRKSRDANRRLIADNGGLRISSDVCSGRTGVTGEAQATGSSHGDGTTTGTISLPEQIDTDLQHTTDEADIILERLRVLRDWVIDQGYSRPQVIHDGPDVDVTY